MGFKEISDMTVPVSFPQDVCLFTLKNSIYAATLHQQHVNNKSILLSIFQKQVNKTSYAVIVF